jgi:hypothetical protein
MEDDTPLDDKYSPEDFTEEAQAEAKADVYRFFDTFAEKMNATTYDYDLNDELVAHDLWLTRCGHGAGFWDGDYPVEIEDVLTDMAHAFGELSIEEDGQGGVYFVRG